MIQLSPDFHETHYTCSAFENNEMVGNDDFLYIFG